MVLLLWAIAHPTSLPPFHVPLLIDAPANHNITMFHDCP
jgi:hypothetical protein